MTLKKLDNWIKSVYVHIPFCEHICFYCDFLKVKTPKDPKLISQYLDQIDNELKSYKNKLDKVETIYIGGGTPSSLNLNQTKKMLQIIKKNIGHKVKEYTIELNPESISEEKLCKYFEFGINRISIGIQTFNDDLLKKIGRKHNSNTAINSFNLVREFGFKNISIDLMYNLFEQTADDVYTDLKFIKKLNPEHISWYSLILKSDSVWGKLKKTLPNNDELYDNIVNEGLSNLGYKRYEVSNYAKKDFESIHNKNYWNNSLFIGIGIGASGYELINEELFLTINKGDIYSYKKDFEKIEDNDYYFQILMMGLRSFEGIELINDNKEAYLMYESKISDQIKWKNLEISNNHLRCTSRGYDILNEILVYLM